MASADVITASIPPTGHNVERRHRHHHCHHGPRSPPYNRQHGHRCRHGAAAAPEDEGVPSSGVMSLPQNHHRGHGHEFWRARAMGVTGNPETQTPLPGTHPDSDDGGLPPSESAGHPGGQHYPGHHHRYAGRSRGFMHHGNPHHSHHGFLPGNVNVVANPVTADDPNLASGSDSPGPSMVGVAEPNLQTSNARSTRGLRCAHKKYKERHGWKCHRGQSAPTPPTREPDNIDSTKAVQETKEALDALDLTGTVPKAAHPAQD